MNLHFKTNIQLKSIIGKDLINDDNIAILELVKNSFDADAKRVDISFFNLKNNDDKIVEPFSENTSRLIIQDDGLGMSLQDVENKWLNIAYSEKKSNSRQHNRMMAGAKGVGRFSCDRLGEYLNLYAKKKDSDKYVCLKIDWKKFEIEDDKIEIQSVEIEYKELTSTELSQKGIKPFLHGVRLEIIKLRSNWVYSIKEKNSEKIVDWNTDKLGNLKKYLEKLINPNQAFEKNDFGIWLDAKEFIEQNDKKEEVEKFIGKIENTIFEKLDFKTTSIESEIIENGSVILTTLKDKGQTIFWIKEKNEFLPELKNIKITLFFLNTYAKAFFTKQTGYRPYQYGSIYLFLNGFRVSPYGQEGDDWLKLEQRKGQGYARFLSQRELVGRIEILDYENSFKVITSREGLEKNEAYIKLINYNSRNDSLFFKIFKRLEKYVVDGLDWDSIPEDEKINEIEKKILSGSLIEDSLVFREDEVTKKRRIYRSIHSIINAKSDNVIELYINEGLILDKIQEEKVNSEREFEQLITDFENKKIDAETLNRILQKKAIENKELEKQLNDFSKYTTNEATTKAIAELLYYKETVEKQSKIIEDLQLRLDREIEERQKQEQILAKLQTEKQQSESKAKEEETKRIEAEKETQRVAEEKNKEIQIEKLKVEFYKKQSSPETDALIHHVKNNSIEIKSNIEETIKKLNDTELSIADLRETLLRDLYNISQYNEKSIKATVLILSSDLALADTQKINLPSFIEGYISNTKFDIDIKFDKKIEEFNIYGSKIELALIFDNLIDNSKKWNAKSIWIEIRIKNNVSIINFYDDGLGLSPQFKSNPNDIFDFKTTGRNEGTGFGLYLVKESLQKMNADIEPDVPINNKGMNFKIIFK
jgi:signal transduction histidine kinase